MYRCYRGANGRNHTKSCDDWVVYELTSGDNQCGGVCGSCPITVSDPYSGGLQSPPIGKFIIQNLGIVVMAVAVMAIFCARHFLWAIIVRRDFRVVSG